MLTPSQIDKTLRSKQLDDIAYIHKPIIKISRLSKCPANHLLLKAKART